jgi:hypothetical protein
VPTIPVSSELSARIAARIEAMQSADLGARLEDLARPPLKHVGALELDAFRSKRHQRACLGRLQTDADRARVLDGLGATGVNGDASLDGLGERCDA